MLRRILYFISPLMVLAFFSLSCVTVNKLPEDAWQGRNRDELREELKKMCDELIPPAEFRKVNTGEMIKPEGGSYSFGYVGEISCNAVKEHYSNILLSQGWKLEEENSSSILTNQTKTDLFYYKDKYLIRITCSKTNSPSPEKDYSLSCGWSKNGY